MTLGANNTFNITLAGGPAQIVTATPNGNGGADVEVLYLSASEAATFASQACIANPATKTVTGTVAGLGVGQSAVISFGSGSVTVNTNGPFTITDANAGASDLVAVRQTFNLATFITTVDRVIVRRNQNPAPGGAISGTIDFGAAEAVAPASAAYTIANLAAGEQVFGATGSRPRMEGARSFPTSATLTGAFTNPLTVFGVPSSLTQAGDFNSVSVFAFATTGNTTTARGIFQYNREVAARTITLGGNLAAPTFTTLATAPYARIRAAGAWPADYGGFLLVNYSQNNRSVTGRSRRLARTSARRAPSSWTSRLERCSWLPEFVGPAAGCADGLRVQLVFRPAGPDDDHGRLELRFATRSGEITP